MAEVAFTLNGRERTIDTEPERPLLDVIREDCGLTGAKYGCGEGSCRSCVALVDGRPVTTCQTPAAKAAGKTIVTIEGLAGDGALLPIQEAFVAELAMQCGYCVPGMVLTAHALLESNPAPSRDEIAEFMNGNICRCCNYANIIRAVERAAKAMQGAAS